MAILVIAGQARKVGKTSLACAILRAFPEQDWTAIKITSHLHTGQRITEEHEADESTDTARYRAAGARRAFLIETHDLEHTIADVDHLIGESRHVLIESNHVLLYRKPDLALLVTSNDISQVKPSAIAILDRIDSVVTAGVTPALLELVRSKLTTA